MHGAIGVGPLKARPVRRLLLNGYLERGALGARAVTRALDGHRGGADLDVVLVGKRVVGALLVGGRA